MAKRLIKIVLCVLTCCICVLPLSLSKYHKASVSVPQAKPSVEALTIAYYDGKYGSTWIKEITNYYKELNPKLKIILEPSSSINQKIGSILNSEKDAPDIVFLSNTNWEYWAAKGYLTDLSGLYATKVDGVPIKSKIVPQYLTHCGYKAKYWIMPWDDGVTGFIYNKTMFDQYDWPVPETMQELYELLPQIKSQGITPIAWSGKGIGDWEYAFGCWWAQAEGKNGISQFLQMKTPEVYSQPGRVTALDTFLNLVGDNSNNMNNVINADASHAQNMFLSGKAAMLLGGSWFESKVQDVNQSGFEMRMMRFPVIDGAKDTKINFTAAGDFAIIPANAENICGAEDFLAYMSSDSVLSIFTQITGSPRPFKYKPSDNYYLDGFTHSVADIWENSDNVYMFSGSPLYYNTFSDWPQSGSPYLQLYYGNITPQDAVENNYQYIKNHWSEAIKTADKH